MGARPIFGLAVMLLATCAMKAAIAADRATPSIEKASGIWSFYDRTKEGRSFILYESDPNSIALLAFECINDDDSLDALDGFGSLNFSVRLPTMDWKGKSVDTINISSGDIVLELENRYMSGSEWERQSANGEISRLERPVFYGLFNASDTLTVEAKGRKIQFDLHGSKEAVNQLQQACP